MKKVYKTPTITSESIKIGVFGCSKYGIINPWRPPTGGGFNPGSWNNFGWWNKKK